jgi:hypothetical protein
MLWCMAAPTRPGAPPVPEVEEPDISELVTETEEPVDNPLSEKQMRLLTEPLYSSWQGPPPREDGLPRKFVAAANVGVFATPREPPLVPDVFLSMDVELHPWLAHEKRHSAYLLWELGKPPDVAIEIVSNQEGEELTRKKLRYARMRVLYYAVWDPYGMLGERMLHSFELRGDLYVPQRAAWFEAVGLGLTEWQGRFEEIEGGFLRWCRTDGSVIPTGAERAEQERARAEQERARAEQERARAEQERARAEQLAARLRELGVEPED